MLRQVIVELWPLEELGGATRDGAESPKTRSCPAKWSRPSQYAYQVEALDDAHRLQPFPATHPSFARIVRKPILAHIARDTRCEAEFPKSLSSPADWSEPPQYAY